MSVESYTLHFNGIRLKVIWKDSHVWLQRLGLIHSREDFELGTPLQNQCLRKINLVTLQIERKRHFKTIDYR